MTCTAGLFDSADASRYSALFVSQGYHDLGNTPEKAEVVESDRKRVVDDGFDYHWHLTDGDVPKSGQI